VKTNHTLKVQSKTNKGLVVNCLMNDNELYIGKIMNRRQTTMMAVVSMALLATMITISSPTPALAHGHWNPDGDFTLQPESESDLNEMQIKPLTADKVLPEEPAIASSNIEEVQQPVASEKIQMISIPEEVCGDGIDNDGDALIDFSDEQCSARETQQQQQQQQPILQQEPVVVSGAEICDDDLDNDFDGKVDSRDEECSYITSSTSAFPPSGQAEPETGEVTEREDEEDEQQQSDEDLNEESGGNENSDGEGDKEDNDSNDDEQDEDEEDEQQSDNEGNDDDEDEEDEDDE
jgi:hypothetical protein